MSLATLLRKVDPDKAVDLADPRFIADSRRRHRLALREDEVLAEVVRLKTREVSCTHKAKRCKVASNGRRKATQEAQACAGMAVLLGQAMRGEKTPKLPPQAAFTPALNRARELYNELIAT